jgi:hypothetical protein
MTLEPWDVELVRRQGAGSLVRVGQEGRLMLDVDGKPSRVDLSWVDEAALALAQAAVAKRRNLIFVYPAPAGQVAVLMAAQVAINLTQSKHAAPLVGLLTADPAGATRVWQQIRIKTIGDRAPLTDLLPVWRAHPDGQAPMGHRKAQGVLIGKRCQAWPVPVTIVDHLAGPVDGEPCGTCIHIFADPVDPALADIAGGEALVWGWSDSIIALWNEEIETAAPGTVPFSVANERLGAMGEGVTIRTVVTQKQQALAQFRAAPNTDAAHDVMGITPYFYALLPIDRGMEGTFTRPIATAPQC